MGGGTSRQFNLIRELSRRHEFTVVTYAYPTDLPHRQDLASFARRVEVIELPLPARESHSRLYWRLNAWQHTLVDPYPLRGQFPRTADMRRAITGLLSGEQFDVIQVHQAYLARPMPRTGAATVLDMHDILSEHERLVMLAQTKVPRRFQAWVEWKKTQWLERKAVRRFDVTVTVSESDKASLLRLIPDARVMVVPNGVDVDYFQPQPASEEESALCFVGSMNYRPNSDGVLWFHRTILPLIRQQVPEVRLYVVGWDPPPQITALNADPHVTVTGFVEDVRPYLANSAVVLVPIRFGSGTRLKILDAWAMGKAVVSTHLGAAGLEAIHGENILQADEPEPFAQWVVGLLADAGQRARLGQAGRRLVEARYAWSIISKELEAAYEVAMAHEDS